MDNSKNTYYNNRKNNRFYYNKKLKLMGSNPKADRAMVGELIFWQAQASREVQLPSRAIQQTHHMELTIVE